MMRRYVSATIVMITLTTALGCAPSLARLERGHHYNEAVCGAAEGALPKAAVAASVRRALDPALHLAVVPHAALVAATGDPLPELQHHTLVRVTLNTRQIDLGSVHGTVSLRRGADIIEPIDVDHPQLVALLGETLPQPRTVRPGPIAQLFDAVGVAIGVAVHVGTLGAVPGVALTAPSGARTVYPDSDDMRRAAPRTSSLLAAIAHLHGRCTSQPGTTCHELMIFDVPALASDPLTVVLELGYASSCTTIFDEIAIPLPPGPTLADRVTAHFGGALARVEVLAARP